MEKRTITGIFGALAIICFFGVLVMAYEHGVKADQSLISTPSVILAGMGTPSSNGWPCVAGIASASTTSLYNQRDAAGNSIWKCGLSADGVTYSWQAPFTAGTPFQNQDWTVQPGLFAASVVKSTVYYEVNAVTLLSLTTREEGSPICTAAPVLAILDLGTSPSTAYASATVLYSQTLSTSNTVASNTGLSIAIAAGHYLGIGFSAGTCVTPPTISAVATLQ